MIVLKISMLEGRSTSQKSNLIRRLTAAAALHFGHESSEVRVIITEIPKTNWGSSGISIAEREGGQNATH